MEFTLEQFKEWVNEVFPDNVARAIAERDFRDGLSKMADFVFTTNSSGFIQQSIATVTQIKQDAINSGETIQNNLVTAGNLLTLTQGERIITEGLKNQAQILVNNAVLADNPLGDYNAGTNTPAISAVPAAAPGMPKGSWYNVTEPGVLAFAGSNFASGKSVSIGGKIVKKSETQWYYQEPSDQSATKIVALEKKTVFTKDVDTGNPQIAIPYTDPTGKVFMLIFTNGRIQNVHIQEIEGKITAVETSIASINAILPSMALTANTIKETGVNKYGYEFFVPTQDGGTLLGLKADGTLWTPNIEKLEAAVFGGSQATNGLSIADTKIIFGNHLFAVEGRDISLFGESMLRTRLKNNLAYSFALQSVNNSVATNRLFTKQVTTNASNLGTTAIIKLKNYAQDEIEKVKNLTVIKSAANKVSSPRYTQFTDSIGYDSLDKVVSKCATTAITPVFFGTRKTAGNNWSESRAGWRAADFVNIINTNYAPLPVGQEAAYIAAGNDTRNPFIRVATGSDPVGNVKNGYIFDYQFYLTRFGFAPPDVAHIALCTNDIANNGTSVGTANTLEAIRIMVASIKATNANCKIGISIPMPLYSAYYNPVWYNAYVPLFTSLQQIYGSLSASGIYIVSVHAYMSDQFIYRNTYDSTDAQTGEISEKTLDGIHQSEVGLNVIAEPYFSFLHSIC